ncbi:MAG: DUF1800 domain-containing protein [Desulfuromusa sp.]
MRRNIIYYIFFGVFSLFVAGCGGGGGSGQSSGTAGGTTQPTRGVASEQEAAAFLSRSSFGATQEQIDALVAAENYEQWFDAQFALSPNFHTDWAETHARGINGTGDLKDNPEDWRVYSGALSYLQRDAWWDIVVNGEDQLRQRVAFALSEIMVISKFGSLINEPDARMSYYDLLVRNALGNFKTLLKEVTYHPAMGKYLTYLGNAKADPNKGNHPDENYAREVMQLFTIGLFQLNLDGSIKLDGQGKPLPTYLQQDIEEMAKVFTGLSDQNSFFFAGDGGSTHFSRTQPMIPYGQHHDSSSKHILGQIIAAGGSTDADIDQAIDILFNHPNTGPFIARRLIQRLVTSNPSPQYVQRVATVFNDNGQGERGDLKEVVKALLLDEEAFDGVESRAQTFGKAREPLLFVAHLLRAFHAQKGMNTLYQGADALYEYSSYNLHGTGYTQQEGPLEALTVFNYFTPDDAPYSLKKEGLVAPEFEVFGTSGLHQMLMGLINKDGFIYGTHNLTAELQLGAEKSLLDAGKYDELLSRLNILLVGGQMSDYSKNAIKTYIEQDADIESDKLVRYVIGLIMISPDYAIQR